jgi:hypothetical protein
VRLHEETDRGGSLDYVNTNDLMYLETWKQCKLETEVIARGK